MIKISDEEREEIRVLTEKLRPFITKDTIIICIGTPKNTMDCLGPLVGTLIGENTFNEVQVFGTLQDPIHALNINRKSEYLKAVFKDSKILAIDACVGDSDSVGDTKFAEDPIHLGKGCSKSLPDIGDYSIAGILCDYGSSTFLIGYNNSLTDTLRMAKIIAGAILSVLGYDKMEMGVIL